MLVAKFISMYELTHCYHVIVACMNTFLHCTKSLFFNAMTFMFFFPEKLGQVKMQNLRKSNQMRTWTKKVSFSMILLYIKKQHLAVSIIPM